VVHDTNRELSWLGRANDAVALPPLTEAQVDGLGRESPVEDELVVQAEAIPPDKLARILDDAIRENLDLDRMSEIAARSARIRADFEAALRAADLWGSE
jgi:hypothetical protein